MLSALPPEVAGFLALLALALLPGLLVVRAPWTAVPALSVAFWTLSWWWIPLGARSRLLEGALLLFVVLALLRLIPRHVVPPPPEYGGSAPAPPVTGPTTGDVPRLRSTPSLVVVGVALVMAAPVPLWHHVPGGEMAFHTTSARLAVWRDGLPASYEPLLPSAPFGAHAPALSALAADASLLSGLDPGQSVVVADLLSAALLLLALFAVLATRMRARAAALGALLGLAGAPWPGFLAMWGEGGPVLALALGLSAAALLTGHASRPSAVAAGMLLGAGALAQPLLTLLVGVGAAAAVGAGVGRTGAPRLGIACSVAAVLAAPALVRMARGTSSREAAGLLAAIDGRDLMSFATGLALMLLAALLAHWLRGSRPRSRVPVAALVGVSAAVLLIGVHAGPVRGQLDAATLRALSTLERDARPLEAVCAPAGLAEWVPALGGRVIGEPDRRPVTPWLPHALRDEWARRAQKDCSTFLDASPEP